MKESRKIMPSSSDIDAVNALFKKFRACSDALTDAYVKWEKRKQSSVEIRTLQEKVDKANKAFEDFKARMGEVKFDIEHGEFFPARDERGIENFRIKVTRTQTKVLTVPALDEKTAIDCAKVFVYGQKFGPAETTYENISR